MVGPHRSGRRLCWRRWQSACDLSESQSDQRQGTVALSVAMDARGTHARKGTCNEPNWTALQSTSPARVHARLLFGQRASSLWDPRIELRAARAGMGKAEGEGG